MKDISFNSFVAGLTVSAVFFAISLYIQHLHSEIHDLKLRDNHLKERIDTTNERIDNLFLQEILKDIKNK